MRTLTEILTDELNAANPIIEPDFDEVEIEITQYCQYMEPEERDAA